MFNLFFGAIRYFFLFKEQLHTKDIGQSLTLDKFLIPETFSPSGCRFLAVHVCKMRRMREIFKANLPPPFHCSAKNAIQITIPTLSSLYLFQYEI